MSAINVLLGAGEAHIVTDGAGTTLVNFTGTAKRALVMSYPKILPVPHLGLALVFRGRVGLQSAVLFRAARARTVEDLREKLPQELRRSYRMRAKLLPLFYGFDLVVAGVRDGKEFAFIVSSVPTYGLEPFIPVEIRHGLCSPKLSDDALADGWQTPGRDRSRSLDAAACRILEDQRSSGIVGAFGQITSVTQFGIYTRIIKRWPDELGKPLAGGDGV
ncbi:hypothetical protein [Ciceribacter selenitireducens]